MTGNMALGIVMAFGALSLVIVGLARRRLPFGRLFGMAAIWVAIIILAMMIASMGLRL